MIGLQMFHEMDNLQREMEQLISGFGLRSMTGEVSQTARYKLRDTGEAFELEAQLPGLDIDKLDISMLGRSLTLTGEFAAADIPGTATWQRRERQAGRFEKSLQLTANVEADRVEAEYQQGILRINLPKAASGLPKKISVKVA